MMNNNNSLKGPANPRYKTMMCKNYNTEQGCQYGEKCQFAHGVELCKLRRILKSMLD